MMFISKKRSVIVLCLILLASLWVIFQNVSFHKSLFKWNDVRHEAIQLSQLHSMQTNLNIKRVSFEFHPPPVFEGEVHSDGYTAEDLYFRRWQIAHNVEPVRIHKETPDDQRWKGWASNHLKGNQKVPDNYMYEAMKRRQEDHMRKVKEAKRKYLEEKLEQSEEEESTPNNAEVANDMSSSYSVKSSWLRARLESYCNEKGTMTGDEGTSPGNYNLQSVYVLARHGDRTPIETGKTGKLAPFKWECSLKEANKKIGSIHMEKFLRLLRIGLKDVSNIDADLKNVLLRIPVRDWSVGCYASQLTPQGWVQHMRLGDFLKKRYWTPLKLGMDSTDMQKISVKSTTSPRTTQSAIAFLFGFLPKFSFSDVAKIKKAESPTFCAERTCLCAAVEKLKDDVVNEYSVLHKRKNTTSLSRRASRLMYIKDPLYSIPNPSRLVELLTSRACHKSSLPCTDSGCVDDKLFEEIFKEVDSITAQVHSGGNTSAEMYGRMAMHPLFVKMSFTMKYIDIGHLSLPRFYLYMGHDITLTPTLDALGLSSPWPGYASRVVFEHWTHATTRKSALKILYNGVDVTSKVWFCSAKLLDNGLCPLTAFLQFIDTENLRVFNAETYEEACTWGITTSSRF